MVAKKNGATNRNRRIKRPVADDVDENNTQKAEVSSGGRYDDSKLRLMAIAATETLIDCSRRWGDTSSGCRL